MSPHRCWLMDLGNSRLKLALLDDAGVLDQSIALDIADPAFIDTLLDATARAPDAPVWMASVGPASVAAQVQRALIHAGHRLQRVLPQARLGQLRSAYAEPSSLGVDRFLGMLAALERVDGPWLIVSAGSALTVDLLDSDGTHRGGLIAPMPPELRSALAMRLPTLDLAAGTARPFADNTADAVASGIQCALVGLVERCLRQAEHQLGKSPTLLITGGGSGLLAAVCHRSIIVLPDLVLRGLAVVARGDVK